MLRVKVDRKSRLELDGRKIQSTSRYYMAKNGGTLVKISPPPEDAVMGAYKRKNGVSQAQYLAVMQAGNWEWNGDVCTGNKSRYEDRRTGIESGWKIAECNDTGSFDFRNLDYSYYINEAVKLIIT